MADLRETLEHLVALAPPPRAGFQNELWDRIQASERTAARRWRAAAVVATAAALGATTAAGVLAFGQTVRGTVDRTLSCPVPDKGGVNLVNLFARVKGEPPTLFNGHHRPNPMTVEADVGRTPYAVEGILHVIETTLTGASPAFKGGYTFDQTICRLTKPIPLAPAGLPMAGVLKGASSGEVAKDCWLAPSATVRMRVTVNAAGSPVAAKLALRSGRKLRPVAYIEWAPTLVRAWISPSICHPHSGL